MFCSIYRYKLLFNLNCGKCYARKAQDTMRTYSWGIGEVFHFFALSILLLSQLLYELWTFYYIAKPPCVNCLPLQTVAGWGWGGHPLGRRKPDSSSRGRCHATLGGCVQASLKFAHGSWCLCTPAFPGMEPFFRGAPPGPQTCPHRD